MTIPCDLYSSPMSSLSLSPHSPNWSSEGRTVVPQSHAECRIWSDSLCWTSSHQYRLIVVGPAQEWQSCWNLTITISRLFSHGWASEFFFYYKTILSAEARKLIELKITNAQKSFKCFKAAVKAHSVKLETYLCFCSTIFFIKTVHSLREIAENLRSYYLRFLRFLRPFEKSANRKKLKNRKNRKMFCDWTP